MRSVYRQHPTGHDGAHLDEEFGTLNAKALETALETLSGLHQDGKRELFRGVKKCENAAIGHKMRF
ncbi:MAG: hypothetical protein JRH15_13785 [Deltaproteobacteria bacterium]|nr:hypothetical protein [Deltaproteobacteria bacterium]